MAKYHISRHDGVLRECTATKQACTACPLSLHFYSIESGQKFVDDYNEKVVSGLFDNMRLSDYVDDDDISPEELQRSYVLNKYSIKYLPSSELKAISDFAKVEELQKKIDEYTNSELNDKLTKAQTLEDRLNYLNTDEGEKDWKSRYAQENTSNIGNYVKVPPKTVTLKEEAHIEFADGTGDFFPTKEVILIDNGDGTMGYKFPDSVSIPNKPIKTVSFDTGAGTIEAVRFKNAVKEASEKEGSPQQILDSAFQNERAEMQNEISNLRESEVDLFAMKRELSEQEELKQLAEDELEFRGKISEKYGKAVLDRSTLNKIGSIYDDEYKCYFILEK